MATAANRGQSSPPAPSSSPYSHFASQCKQVLLLGLILRLPREQLEHQSDISGGVTAKDAQPSAGVIDHIPDKDAKAAEVVIEKFVRCPVSESDKPGKGCGCVRDEHSETLIRRVEPIGIPPRVASSSFQGGWGRGRWGGPGE